jgi:hypothetical protein
LNNLDKHASTIAQVTALFLVCATVIVLAMWAKLSEGLMGMLIGGIISVAGAISGFSKHSPDTPPGMTSQQTLTTAIPPSIPNGQEKLNV